jgi:hypothetical protein
MKVIFERHFPLSVKRTARKKPWFKVIARYLFDMLQFGQSSRFFSLITPVQRTAF